ncbi:uncharacterized protein LOC129093157 [Anoplopoma fimbria]|uniref:uncharacterized protein LOC129093157 n=1 Tax=Anoplopoma fimbria TaxID=229290 RepID=UPI0023EBC87E|nr:uncharacterized protein LOC129093157 [Anoplopoma fimbria]
MKNFTLITALSLCSFSWISVSGFDFETVEVQAGGEVELQCSNFSSSLSQIIWFRVVKRHPTRQIAYIYEPFEPTKFPDGFKNGKFEVRSNLCSVFLNIKQVNSSDSGLYFCGYYISRNPVIVDSTYLEVQEAFDGMTKLPTLILSGLTVLLVMVIMCLAVKVKKLQKTHGEEHNPQRTKNQDSEELHYAAVAFQPKTKRNQRPASENEAETNTIYSATR